MTTTDSPRPAADGWAWLEDGLPRNERVTTTLLNSWDGMFTADCPCGSHVDWDAFTFQPICTCAVLFPDLLPPVIAEADDDEVPA